MAGGTAASSGGTGTASGAATPGVFSTSNPTQGYLQTYTSSTDASGYTMPTGSTSAQQLQYLAGYLGVPPDQVQSQYNAYAAGFMGGRPQGGRAGAGDVPASSQTALPIDQWVASQVNSIEGTYAPILNAYEQAWEQTNNSPMPLVQRSRS